MPVDHERARRLDLIRDLDKVIAEHTRWLDGFNRALLCGGANEVPGGLSAFDHWHLGLASELRRQWRADLEHVLADHNKLHALAEQLRQGPGAPAVCTRTYDRFTEAARRFKAGVRALQFRIIHDFCELDHLTGIWNRNALFERLSAEHARMLRHAGAGCLCMMDLDHFKAINDRHGHVAGDFVLRDVIRIARQRLRPYDSLFRYGGEEFLFCLPHITPQGAVAAMERIRTDIAGTPIRLGDGHEVAITASFGVAQFSATLSIEENIELADRALLCAKAGGRNRVCGWGDADGAPA